LFVFLLHAAIRLVSRALRLRRTARVARPNLNLAGHALGLAIVIYAARHAAIDIADFLDVFLTHRNASFRGAFRARIYLLHPLAFYAEQSGGKNMNRLVTGLKANRYFLDIKILWI
jgi:hypothetical protein